MRSPVREASEVTKTSVGETQARVIAFLSSPPILDASGDLYSWINPAHPGYVYPEGMGLYLTLMSQLAADRDDPSLVKTTHRVAERLQAIAHPSGGLGIHGQLYPFDVCMAVTGLLTYQERLNGRVNPGVLARMAHFIVDMARRRLTVLNEDGGLPDVAPHWSTVFGASMLKEVIALDKLVEETGEGQYKSLAIEVADEVIAGCYDDGAFRTIPGSGETYTHPHCYALEGLLHLRARGYRDTTGLLRAGADRLRVWQDADGSLYNWYDAPARERSKVGDATSQAVRIWLAVDSDAYADHIARGLAFLAGLISPGGGLYYCTGSADVNSITSIFAAQAMEWYLHGVRADAIA